MNCILIFQKLSTIKSETLLTLKYIPIALFLSNIDVWGGEPPPYDFALRDAKGSTIHVPSPTFQDLLIIKKIRPLILMVREDF